ncbi:Uncharacterised protein [Vibrio cholerae]|nr:Uncharacterised protein [Vibrio cholerae]
MTSLFNISKVSSNLWATDKPHPPVRESCDTTTDTAA